MIGNEDQNLVGSDGITEVLLEHLHLLSCEQKIHEYEYGDLFLFEFSISKITSERNIPTIKIISTSEDDAFYLADEMFEDFRYDDEDCCCDCDCDCCRCNRNDDFLDYEQPKLLTTKKVLIVDTKQQPFFSEQFLRTWSLKRA